MSKRIDELLAAMTTEEKVAMVTGGDMWHTRGVERLGVPKLKLTDGPNGARGDGLMGTGSRTACIPSGAVLGATWDPGLVEELGELLGDEALSKRSQVLLAPTINLHRSPKGGRNFESFSEDPILTGRMAAAFVRGVQSRGVATTAKHFVGNDSEFERNSIDTQVDERTLRELYLVPFEHAVKDGGSWGIMSAYNRLNGTFCADNHWLLTTVLREEWGFDGFVVTDWFGARSTVDMANAGLSLEMPGEGRWYGNLLTDAVNDGEVSPSALDRIAADVLTLMERTGRAGPRQRFRRDRTGPSRGPGLDSSCRGGRFGVVAQRRGSAAQSRRDHQVGRDRSQCFQRQGDGRRFRQSQGLPRDLASGCSERTIARCRGCLGEGLRH